MKVPSSAEYITLLCQESSTPSSIPRSIGHVATALMVSGLEYGNDLLLHPMYGIKPVTERELALPSPMISRLVEFYDKHLIRDPESSPAWNCHSFTKTMMGWETKKEALEPVAAKRELAKAALQCGDPYLIQDKGAATHSMIGIDTPDECMAVVGARRPLKIMNTMDVISLWGDSIHEAQCPPY